MGQLSYSLENAIADCQVVYNAYIDRHPTSEPLTIPLTIIDRAYKHILHKCREMPENLAESIAEQALIEVFGTTG